MGDDPAGSLWMATSTPVDGLLGEDLVAARLTYEGWDVFHHEHPAVTPGAERDQLILIDARVA